MPCRRRCLPPRCSGRRRVSGQSARLADSGRCAASHRSSPQRKRPSSSRNGRGDGSIQSMPRHRSVCRRSRALCQRQRGRRATDPDDTLVLLFMCCHPSLTSSSAVALTLRAVGGLTTAEIAKAFLVPEVDDGAADQSREADASRRRACRSDADTRRARRAADRRAARALSDLQRGIHELRSAPRLQRTELSSEAIRLARALHQLLPDEC